MAQDKRRGRRERLSDVQCFSLLFPKPHGSFQTIRVNHTGGDIISPTGTGKCCGSSMSDGLMVKI